MKNKYNIDNYKGREFNRDEIVGFWNGADFMSNFY